MTDEPTPSSDQRKPLAEIEIGLTVAQAIAIVQEFDALWLAAAFYGKKKQKELLRLRNTLEEAVKAPGETARLGAQGVGG